MDNFYHPSMVVSIHCNYHSYLDGLSHMDGLKIEPRGYLSILVSNPVLTISHYKSYWWSISQYVYHLKMTIIGFTTLIHLGCTRWWTIYRGTKKHSGTVGSSPTFPGLRGGSASTERIGTWNSPGFLSHLSASAYHHFKNRMKILQVRWWLPESPKLLVHFLTMVNPQNEIKKWPWPGREDGEYPTWNHELVVNGQCIHLPNRPHQCVFLLDAKPRIHISVPDGSECIHDFLVPQPLKLYIYICIIYQPLYLYI